MKSIQISISIHYYLYNIDNFFFGCPTSVEKFILMRYNGHVQIKNNNTYTYLIQHRGERRETHDLCITLFSLRRCRA